MNTTTTTTTRPPTQRATVIATLRRTPGLSLTAAEIARDLGFEKSSVSAVLSDLIRESAVHRGPGIYAIGELRRRSYQWAPQRPDNAVDPTTRSKPKPKQEQEQEQEQPESGPLVQFDWYPDHVAMAGALTHEQAAKVMEVLR